MIGIVDHVEGASYLNGDSPPKEWWANLSIEMMIWGVKWRKVVALLSPNENVICRNAESIRVVGDRFESLIAHYQIYPHRSMSQFIYILYSPSRDRYYVGRTSNLDGRLIRHNTARTGFTSTGQPWQIVYSEEFDTLQEACRRERQLKGWKNRNRLERLIQT